MTKGTPMIDYYGYRFEVAFVSWKPGTTGITAQAWSPRADTAQPMENAE